MLKKKQMVSTSFYVYLLITSVACINASWIYSQYKKAMVDYFRMEIFAVRDNLFDVAATGNISFDNEADKIMRTLVSCAFNNLYAQQTKFLSSKQKSFGCAFVKLVGLEYEQRHHPQNYYSYNQQTGSKIKSQFSFSHMVLIIFPFSVIKCCLAA